MQHLVDMLPEGQQINLVVFGEYIKPAGQLTHQIECHALFYYYLHARRTYEENILSQPLVLEGEKDSGINFKQLFESIASLYGVKQEKMAGFWPLIDAQCMQSGLPLMPEGWEYRFKSIIQLDS